MAEQKSSWRDHLLPDERRELVLLEDEIAKIDLQREALTARRYRLQQRAAKRARRDRSVELT